MRHIYARAACALLIGVALATLVACAGSRGATQRTQEQTIEGLTVALTSADAPVMNTTQELVVTLTDEQGALVEGADVYLDLTMPAMPMGTNRPIATPGAGGTYRVQTAFTMTGDLTVTVVTETDNQERRATFTIIVVEQ